MLEDAAIGWQHRHAIIALQNNAVAARGQHTAPTGTSSMPNQDQADLRMNLARLRQEHEDFDVAINAMIQTGCDALRIQRMKKKKLVIKDTITKIEDQVIPDIIA